MGLRQHALEGAEVTRRHVLAAISGRSGLSCDAALGAFCDEWSRRTSSLQHLEAEYLLTVGTRR